MSNDNDFFDAMSIAEAIDRNTDELIAVKGLIRGILRELKVQTKLLKSDSEKRKG
jgi:hypothetical protein